MHTFVPEFADREPQIAAFEQVLAGLLPRRIFLIGGAQEIGKSFLLDQLQFMAAPRAISRLDFRDGEVHTFLSIIHTAIRDLGEATFAATRREIRKITLGTRHDITLRAEVHQPDAPHGGITLRDISESQIHVGGDLVGGSLYKNAFFLPPGDPGQQRALEQELSTIFFDELRALAAAHPVILCYDSFENAPDEARRWLTGLLLDEMARGLLPGVLVIVAGRATPEIAHMLVPHVVATELRNFDLAAASDYWVNRRGLPPDALPAAYEETGGHPKRLAEEANRSGGRPLAHQVVVI